MFLFEYRSAPREQGTRRTGMLLEKSFRDTVVPRWTITIVLRQILRLQRHVRSAAFTAQTA